LKGKWSDPLSTTRLPFGEKKRVEGEITKVRKIYGCDPQ